MKNEKGQEVIAGTGVRYDPIVALAELVKSHPGYGELLRQRAALLEQGVLEEVAARIRGMQASSPQ